MEIKDVGRRNNICGNSKLYILEMIQMMKFLLDQRKYKYAMENNSNHISNGNKLQIYEWNIQFSEPITTKYTFYKTKIF